MVPRAKLLLACSTENSLRHLGGTVALPPPLHLHVGLKRKIGRVTHRESDSSSPEDKGDSGGMSSSGGNSGENGGLCALTTGTAGNSRIAADSDMNRKSRDGKDGHQEERPTVGFVAKGMLGRGGSVEGDYCGLKLPSRTHKSNLKISVLHLHYMQ